MKSLRLFSTFGIFFLFHLSLNAQDFKPTGKFSGLVFMDYFYKIHADNDYRGNLQYSRIKKDVNTFDIRRFYLGYTTKFLPSFTAEALISHEDNRALFVKIANLRYHNLFQGTDLIVGLLRTPAFSTSGATETVWEYRSIEKTIADHRGLVKSVDLGVSLEGKYGDGKWGYDLTFGANSAATVFHPPQTSKRVYGDIYVRLLDKRLLVQLYNDYFRVFTTNNHMITSKLLVAYTSRGFIIGTEGITRNVLNSGNVIDRPLGISSFFRINAITDSAGIPKFAIFGRYDHWDPDLEYQNSLIVFPRESFITAGIDFTPNKNLHIMPNFWYNSYQPKNGTNFNNDIVARITLFYKY